MSARLVLIGVALALAAPTAPGVPGGLGQSPPSPVRAQPLASGEILLETGGISLLSTRADTARLTISVRAGGETIAEASREADARARSILEAVRRPGIPAAAIMLRSAASEFTMAPAMENMVMETPPDMAAHNATRTITVRLSDVGRIESVRAAAEAAGAEEISGPVYSLADPGPARRQARIQALAGARADAEAQAAAMGMRVARIVRITERVGMDMFSYILGVVPGLRGADSNIGEEQMDPDIPTLALVGVDFALAPR